MKCLEIGQVLWLKVKYQIDKESDVSHPMLVYEISDKFIEIIAMDKTKDRTYQLFMPYNIYINSKDPNEKVIYEDSYAQSNNILTIENFPEIVNSRKTEDKLSNEKLKNVFDTYKDWQSCNIVPENRIVHMTKEDIIRLNICCNKKE